MNMISRIATVVDDRNTKAVERHRNFKIELQELGVCVRPAPNMSSPDCIAVFGGDGTMLKAIQWHLHMCVPFLGVACGDIGALGNDPENPIEERLAAGLVGKVSFPVIRFNAVTGDGGQIEGVGVNDVALQRRNLLQGTCHLQVSVDGKMLDSRLRGDGLVVATPLGSTAYNLHAGGPVIDVTENLLVTTGIVAERVFPSVVHNGKAEIHVSVLRPDEGVLLIADNAVWDEVREATFWLEHNALQLMFLEPLSFVERLHRIARKRRELIKSY